MPHVYVIIFAILLLATILTWVIPAGTYDFIEVNGKSVVDPATFHYIERTPVSLWEMVLSIPEGMVKQASLIIATFIITGAINIINHTHSLESTIGKFASLCRKRLYIAVPLFMLPFVVIGSMGIAEQVIAFVSLGIMIGLALGADAVAGTAMVILGMSAGFSLAPFGTSTTATAQTIVGLPLYSGYGYRLICVGVLWIITTIYIIHYIKKVQSDPTRSVVYGDEEVVKQAEDVALPEVTLRRILVLVIFFAAFVAIFSTVVKGVCTIMVLCGIFLIAGILAGAVYGYTPNEIAKYFVEGCTDMAFGALLIGMAASIGVVLTKGNIIYTCVHALCSLLNNMPVALAGVFMNIINIFVNFFIISGSGQAATVMPILGPTASVLGMTQQTAILAYQLGDGFTNMIYPHSGTLMAALAIGRIPWQKWAKWAWKFILIETVAGWVFIAVAALMNWGAMFG